METIAIELPASLYVMLYDKYGEDANAMIVDAITRLLTDGTSGDTIARPAPLQYPRPKAGTKTGQVWEIADQIKRETGAADRESVIRACMDQGININTASTQYSYWRKVNP